MIKIQLIGNCRTIPSRATKGAAGFDLQAQADYTLSPGEWKEVPTDVAIAIPKGYYGQISSRSGLAFKHKVTAFAGVIDNERHFRGEIKVLLQNWSSEEIRIRKSEDGYGSIGR